MAMPVPCSPGGPAFAQPVSVPTNTIDTTVNNVVADIVAAICPARCLMGGNPTHCQVRLK